MAFYIYEEINWKYRMIWLTLMLFMDLCADKNSCICMGCSFDIYIYKKTKILLITQSCTWNRLGQIYKLTYHLWHITEESFLTMYHTLIRWNACLSFIIMCNPRGSAWVHYKPLAIRTIERYLFKSTAMKSLDFRWIYSKW